MSMVQILQELVSIIIGAISGLATGIGTGISDLVKNMFFTLSEQGAIQGLSPFGGVLAIFAGLSLAIGLSYKIYNLIATFGAKK